MGGVGRGGGMKHDYIYRFKGEIRSFVQTERIFSHGQYSVIEQLISAVKFNNFIAGGAGDSPIFSPLYPYFSALHSSSVLMLPLLRISIDKCSE